MLAHSLEIPAAARFLLRQALYVGFRTCAARQRPFLALFPARVALVAGPLKTVFLAASLGASLGYLFPARMERRHFGIYSERCGACNQFRPPASEKETLSQALSCVTAGLAAWVTGLALGMSGGINGRVGGPLWRRVLLRWRRRLIFLPLFFSPQPVRSPRACLLPRNRLHRIFLCDPVICSLRALMSGTAPARLQPYLILLGALRWEAGGSIAGIVAGVAMGFGEGSRFLTGSCFLAACWPDCSPCLGTWMCGSLCRCQRCGCYFRGRSAQAVHGC